MLWPQQVSTIHYLKDRLPFSVLIQHGISPGQHLQFLHKTQVKSQPELMQSVHFTHILSPGNSHSVLLQPANLQLMVVLLPLVGGASQALHDLVAPALKPNDGPEKEANDHL